MSVSLWTLKLRDDQTQFIIAAMDYLITRHDVAIASSRCEPIDKFAHAQSKERAKEIMDYLASTTT